MTLTEEQTATTGPTEAQQPSANTNEKPQSDSAISLVEASNDPEPTTESFTADGPSNSNEQPATEEIPVVPDFINTTESTPAPNEESAPVKEQGFELEQQQDKTEEGKADDDAKSAEEEEESTKDEHQPKADDAPSSELATSAEEKTAPQSTANKNTDAIQRTLSIIKPDAVQANKQNAIVAKIKDAGFTIVQERQVHLTLDQARLFYREHEGKPFYGELTQWMSSGPIHAMILEKNNAIQDWRAKMGPTDPVKARDIEPNSIRALFGTDGMSNATHGSDCQTSAEREIQILFKTINGQEEEATTKEGEVEKKTITEPVVNAKLQTSDITTEQSTVEQPVKEAAAEPEKDTTDKDVDNSAHDDIATEATKEASNKTDETVTLQQEAEPQDVVETHVEKQEDGVAHHPVTDDKQGDVPLNEEVRQDTHAEANGEATTTTAAEAQKDQESLAKVDNEEQALIEEVDERKDADDDRPAVAGQKDDVTLTDEEASKENGKDVIETEIEKQFDEPVTTGATTPEEPIVETPLDQESTKCSEGQHKTEPVAVSTGKSAAAEEPVQDQEPSLQESANVENNVQKTGTPTENLKKEAEEQIEEDQNSTQPEVPKEPEGATQNQEDSIDCVTADDTSDRHQENVETAKALEDDKEVPAEETNTEPAQSKKEEAASTTDAAEPTDTVLEAAHETVTEHSNTELIDKQNADPTPASRESVSKDELNNESKKEPKEEPKDQLKDESNDEPEEQSKENLEEESKDQSKDELNDKPKDVLKDVPKEELTKEMKEEPKKTSKTVKAASNGSAAKRDTKVAKTSEPTSTTKPKSPSRSPQRTNATNGPTVRTTATAAKRALLAEKKTTTTATATRTAAAVKRTSPTSSGTTAAKTTTAAGGARVPRVATLAKKPAPKTSTGEVGAATENKTPKTRTSVFSRLSAPTATSRTRTQSNDSDDGKPAARTTTRTTATTKTAPVKRAAPTGAASAVSTPATKRTSPAVRTPATGTARTTTTAKSTRATGTTNTTTTTTITPGAKRVVRKAPTATDTKKTTTATTEPAKRVTSKTSTAISTTKRTTATATKKSSTATTKAGAASAIASKATKASKEVKKPVETEQKPVAEAEKKVPVDEAEKPAEQEPAIATTTTPELEEQDGSVDEVNDDEEKEEKPTTGSDVLEDVTEKILGESAAAHDDEVAAVAIKQADPATETLPVADGKVSAGSAASRPRTPEVAQLRNKFESNSLSANDTASTTNTVKDARARSPSNRVKDMINRFTA